MQEDGQGIMNGKQDGWRRKGKARSRGKDFGRQMLRLNKYNEKEM